MFTFATHSLNCPFSIYSIGKPTQGSHHLAKGKQGLFEIAEEGLEVKEGTRVENTGWKERNTDLDNLWTGEQKEYIGTLSGGGVEHCGSE